MTSTNNLFYSFCVSPEEWIIFDPDDDKFRDCEYECWGDDDDEIFVPDDWDLYDDYYKYQEEKNNPKSDHRSERGVCRIVLASISQIMASCSYFWPSFLPPLLDVEDMVDDDDDDDMTSLHIPGDNVDANSDVKNCLGEYIRHAHKYVQLDRQRLKRIEPPEVSLTYWSVYANYSRKDIQHINTHIHPAYEVFSNWYFGEKGFHWTDVGTAVKCDAKPIYRYEREGYDFHRRRCPYDNSHNSNLHYD